MRSKPFGMIFLMELICVYMAYYSCRGTLNKKNSPTWYTMTPISHSRGIMYSAPPKETTRREKDESTEEEATESNTVEAPSVTDANSSVTDANWTGTVPADD